MMGTLKQIENSYEPLFLELNTLLEITQFLTSRPEDAKTILESAGNPLVPIEDEHALRLIHEYIQSRTNLH